MQAKAEYLGYGLCAVTPEKIPEKWSLCVCICTHTHTHSLSLSLSLSHTHKHRSITLFSEELVRGGGCSCVLSSFLRKLDKAMREQGGGAMWQIISQGDPGAKGYMKQVRRSLTAL